MTSFRCHLPVTRIAHSDLPVGEDLFLWENGREDEREREGVMQKEMSLLLLSCQSNLRDYEGIEGHEVPRAAQCVQPPELPLSRVLVLSLA